MKNLSAKLGRQKAVLVQMISVDQGELQILKSKSLETLRAVRTVKLVWPGAKVLNR